MTAIQILEWQLNEKLKQRQLFYKRKKGGDLEKTLVRWNKERNKTISDIKRAIKIMADYCEDCGCKVYNGLCTNCHEELYIEDQYYELDMPLPDEDSEFMKKANECLADVERKRLLNGC